MRSTDIDYDEAGFVGERTFTVDIERDRRSRRSRRVAVTTRCSSSRSVATRATAWRSFVAAAVAVGLLGVLLGARAHPARRSSVPGGGRRAAVGAGCRRTRRRRSRRARRRRAHRRSASRPDRRSTRGRPNRSRPANRNRPPRSVRPTATGSATAADRPAGPAVSAAGQHRRNSHPSAATGLPAATAGPPCIRRPQPPSPASRHGARRRHPRPPPSRRPGGQCATDRLVTATGDDTAPADTAPLDDGFQRTVAT